MDHKEKQKLDMIKSILMSSNVEDTIKENEDLIFDFIPELKFEKGLDQRSKWHC